jgi:methylenetetrahydrofolate dehydrogenase (NADP+) / methenyltetrahydrofolate cyclohydrolase
MTKIIDGKEVAKTIKAKVAEQVADFTKQKNIKPGLATVLVGEDAASQVYVRNKIKSTNNCHMESIHHQLDATVSQAELLSLIEKLNKDPKVHGILVQLPLPAHIESDLVIQSIDPKKDVDGFHPQNMGMLLAGNECLQPCTPLGVMELLKFYNIDLSGKDAVVIGRSNIVGKPQAMMLLKENATVTIVHSRTKDIADKIRSADIVVAAVGKAKFVKADWLKPGAVVIDVGINRLENGKLCGDVDFEAAQSKTSFITPVPGGVGPMTIAMLMSNTLMAAKLQTL